MYDYGHVIRFLFFMNYKQLDKPDLFHINVPIKQYSKQLSSLF